MRAKSVQNIRRSLRRLNQSYGIHDDRRWSEFGVSYALSQVLFVLDEIPAPTAKGVNAILLLDKSTLSRFLSRLEKKNLIKYKLHPSDARSKIINLTEEGKNLLVQLNQYGNARTNRALEGLNSKEISEIEAALAKLENNLTGQRCL